MSTTMSATMTMSATSTTMPNVYPGQVLGEEHALDGRKSKFDDQSVMGDMGSARDTCMSINKIDWKSDSTLILLAKI